MRPEILPWKFGMSNNKAPLLRLQEKLKQNLKPEQPVQTEIPVDAVDALLAVPEAEVMLTPRR